jgi:hypothetical protein
VAGIGSFGNNVKPLSQETPGIGAMAALTAYEIEFGKEPELRYIRDIELILTLIIPTTYFIRKRKKINTRKPSALNNKLRD